MNRTIFLVLFLIFNSLPVSAQGRAPKEEAPKKTNSSPKLHEVKADANEALNKVDRGVHTGFEAAQKGANKALKAVDKEVHEIVGKDK